MDKARFSRTISAENPKTSTKVHNPNSRKDNGSGLRGERSPRRNEGENLRIKGGRGVSKGNSLIRIEDEKRKPNNLGVKRKLEEEDRKDGSGVVGGGEKKMEKVKPSKKVDKVESPALALRVKLELCSKRGDLMGAIRLYDEALKEGIKIQQYLYSVILYLCSSAAIGVIQPAKSGSRSRTLKALNVSHEVPNRNSAELVENNRSTENKMLKFSDNLSSLDSSFSEKMTQFSNGFVKSKSDRSSGRRVYEIQVSEDARGYALKRGFEIYEKMCADNVPMNEATLTAVARMAIAMGNGDMAFDTVKQMVSLGINPRLRSYGPALSAFCKSGDIEKAFVVEKHMLEHGVVPEEPELEALLKISVEAGKADKVYYLLHKLRASVRKVSSSTAETIIKWFECKAASRVGKIKVQERKIKEGIENGGGGWHGQGWLGKGRWTTTRTTVGADALCKCCGEKLTLIDLDPLETEKFAECVASLALKREKNMDFQRFQQWLDSHGPFEAVVDAANVGLFSQTSFNPSKVHDVVNEIRQMFPSRKLPLVVLHNRRISEHMMNKPGNRALIERWNMANALYATPTGSNDDWYWLYAAIKFRCLLVSNDEMRDHTFQLLGNDFFPKWKERHQVRFSVSDDGLALHMPPPFSVVIQESEKGRWHIPIAYEHDNEAKREWLCVTRANSDVVQQASGTGNGDVQPLDDNYVRTIFTKILRKSPTIDSNCKKSPKPSKNMRKTREIEDQHL